MKLLGQSKSINVRKVLWTCAELGLSPEQEEWGAETRGTSAVEFLRINPKGLVPVLIDDGLSLSESNTICRYLAAKTKRTDLLPAEPQSRAKVEAWMDWQISELNNAWRFVFMGRVRKHPDFTDQNAQAKSVKTWNSAMLLLEGHFEQTGPFICGDDFTLADVVLALSTNRWELTPMERPELPRVDAWMELMSSRTGFQDFCRNGIA